MSKSVHIKQLSRLILILISVLLCARPLLAEKDTHPLVVYTSSTATTSILPLLEALKDSWAQDYQPEIKFWKNPEELRTLALASEGDIWVGHVEGLARAAGRGAPVTLLVVSSWTKFYFLSGPNPASSAQPGTYPKSINDIANILANENKPLAIAPQNSPATGLLLYMANNGGPTFMTAPMPLQQLMAELLSERRQCALLPEPILSTILTKMPKLRVVSSLEAEIAARFGGAPRLPLAGIAINQKLLEKDPVFVANLTRSMLQKGQEHKKMSKSELASLFPDQIKKDLGEKILAQSLSRELILVKSASEAKPEIDRFLEMATTDLGPNQKIPVPENFIYEFPPNQ